VTTDAPGRPTARRVDGSMSLLVDMMANTLDEAYAEAAQARGTGPAAPGPDRGPRRRSVRLGPLAGLLAVGLLTGTAVGEVRDRSAESSGLRSGLADEVAARTGQGDALAVQAAALRDEVARCRSRPWAATPPAGPPRATSRPRRRQRHDGGPRAGPGRPARRRTAGRAAADPLRGGTVPEGRVSDQDLQDVVNGLWAAGRRGRRGQPPAADDAQRHPQRGGVGARRPAARSARRTRSRPSGDPAALEVGFVAGPSGRG
jgi:hypothetical protein